MEPVGELLPQLLSSSGCVLLADPSERTRHNRSLCIPLKTCLDVNDAARIFLAVPDKKCVGYPWGSRKAGFCCSNSADQVFVQGILCGHDADDKKADAAGVITIGQHH